MKKEHSKTPSNIFLNIVKIIILLVLVVIIFMLAPNYEKNDTYDMGKINLIIPFIVHLILVCIK